MSKPVITKLYYCPVCGYLQPAWLDRESRDRHMREKHPAVPVPEGSGIPEWHGQRAPKAVG